MDTAEALGLVNSSVRALAAYHLEPRPCTTKLNQNENPWDWPAPTKREMAAFCRTHPWNRYPTFVPTELKAALADYAGADPAGVLVGNGSNEILLALLIALMDRSRPVMLCQPTFTVYELLVRALGGTVETVMLTADELRFDVDAVIDACRRNPGALLLLCSPNNPTGCSLDEPQVRRIMAAHTGMCILDQAYVEFGGYDGTRLLGEYPNLVVTRTFSKAFSAAGLRLGYLVGRPEVVAEVNKVKLPYNINFFCEHAARVLLKNRAEAARRIEAIVGLRSKLMAALKRLPLDKVYATDANFMLVRTGRKDALMEHLASAGILVRDVSRYPMLAGCLRLSVGTAKENGALLAALRSFFGSAGK
jgi:histidinol-phosphate aminotransferase